MVRITSFCFIAFSAAVLASCFSESKVDVAKPETFVRSYSDGYDNQAVQVLENSDGSFIILANSQISNSEAEQTRFKIMLVKTNAFGDELWVRHFPPMNQDTDQGTPPKALNYVGTSVLVTPTGYLITGYQIDQSDVNSAEITDYSPLVLAVSDNGDEQFSAVKKMNYSTNLKSKAVASSNYSTGDYLVLFQAEDPDSSMSVASVKGSDLSISGRQIKYAGAQAILANRLFLETGSTDYISFGGTSTRSNKNDGRLVKVKVGVRTAEFDLNYGDPTPNETILDICKLGAGYAMIGKSDANGNEDVFFLTVNSSGTPLNTSTFVSEILDNATYSNDKQLKKFIDEDLNTKNETGNSISSANDGGVIILGTIDSYGDPVPLGAGNTDMLLMKINGFGERQWVQTIGGKDAETGACVRQASNGGYLVLGTTRIGSRRTIQFVKTDNLGNID